MGSKFLNDLRNRDCVAVGHKELRNVLRGSKSFDVIINFSISALAYGENYDLDLDTNILIANSIKSLKHCRLVMLSTRQVYGSQNYLTEEALVAPVSQYGINKLRVEKEVLKILGPDRVVILRCSNIFGLELGRSTFMGLMCTSLLESNTINFDCSEGTIKDFLSVVDFVEVLRGVISEGLHGVFNVGSGIGLDCGSVARALCHGFGSGEIFFGDKKTEEGFVLDISKIRQVIRYPSMSEEVILSHIRNIGLQLRDDKNNQFS